MRKGEIKKKFYEDYIFFPEKTSPIKMPNLLYLNQINIDNIDIKTLFLKGIIFNSFNNHIKTKYLQKLLIDASKEIITFIIEELKGSFRAVIKNKSGNFFFQI